MPENFLLYLDDLIRGSRAALEKALDDLGDFREAQANASRLYTLIQLRAEAGEYEPV
jgi:hypothetical protein